MAMSRGTTTPSYDAAGRVYQTAVATTGSGTLTTTVTPDSLGRMTQVATSGTSSDTLAESYDTVGRLLAIGRVSGSSTTPVTVFTYNPDGTAATRTDYDPSGASYLNTFTYTSLGQLASASLPGSAGTATYTWRLHGLMATRTWGSSISGTYSYDGAKRPTGLSVKLRRPCI